LREKEEGKKRREEFFISEQSDLARLVGLV